MAWDLLQILWSLALSKVLCSDLDCYCQLPRDGFPTCSVLRLTLCLCLPPHPLFLSLLPKPALPGWGEKMRAHGECSCARQSFHTSPTTLFLTWEQSYETCHWLEQRRGERKGRVGLTCSLGCLDTAEWSSGSLSSCKQSEVVASCYISSWNSWGWEYKTEKERKHSGHRNRSWLKKERGRWEGEDRDLRKPGTRVVSEDLREVLGVFSPGRKGQVKRIDSA